MRGPGLFCLCKESGRAWRGAGPPKCPISVLGRFLYFLFAEIVAVASQETLGSGWHVGHTAQSSNDITLLCISKACVSSVDSEVVEKYSLLSQTLNQSLLISGCHVYKQSC